MGFWQIVYICLLMVSLGIALSEHGKPKTGHNNFWYSLIAVVMQLGILWAGGFFG